MFRKQKKSVSTIEFLPRNEDDEEITNSEIVAGFNSKKYRKKPIQDSNYCYTNPGIVLDEIKQSSTKKPIDNNNEYAPYSCITHCSNKVQNKEESLNYITQVIGGLAGSLIHFSLGTTVGLTGVILPSLMDETSDLHLTEQEAALFSSLMSVGAIFGSVSSGPLTVWLGQRMTLICTLPVATFSWVLLLISSQVWHMHLARFLSGVVVGFFGGPAANFVAEISHSSVRGRLTGLVDLFRNLGLLFVYIVGSSDLSWRETCLVCGTVTTIIPFVFLLFLPNSPRWLVTKSRYSDARESLKFFRGPDYCIDVELKDIHDQLEENSQGSSVKSQLQTLRKESILKRMIVLCLLFFAYQFCGNFSMIVFSVTIFQSVQGDISEYTSTIIVGCVRVFAVLTYVIVADRIGRRPTFIMSLTLSSISMAVLGIFFYIKDEVDGDIANSFSWLPLCTLAVFIYFTCIAEPILMLYRAELLPTVVRPVGVSITYIFFFSGAFLVSFLFPMMMKNIGAYGTFWVYASDGIVMALVAALFMPETKAKSLEDIEQSLKQSSFKLRNRY